MSALASIELMLLIVAKALGEELLAKVAFVGGYTTGLLVTDEYTRQDIRFTDDVDLIVHVVGRASWYDFQKKLRARGFTESMDDDVNCRMRIENLKVDFMPDDEDILGFTNRWYEDALASANPYSLRGEEVIRIVSPDYFIATKLEAFKGRGNGDVLTSHDIEDILTLIDGRPELEEEINHSPPLLSKYISEELQELQKNPAFEYTLASIAKSVERELVLSQRISNIIRRKSVNTPWL